MIKTNFKNVAISLLILLVVITGLSVLDSVLQTSGEESTKIRVTVVDLNDKPVHNAEIHIGDVVFLTDNKGLSPTIELDNLQNVYDNAISSWCTVTVVAKRDGFVPAVVVNCVVYCAQTRWLTIRLYQKDESDLPYVCYVESPPNDYLQDLVEK